MMKKIIFILVNVLFMNISAQENIISQINDYSNININEILFVSVTNQKMYHIKNNTIIDEYIISTSEFGIGSKAGSNKTPLGMHQIKSKHGDKTPIYGRMTGRVFNGEISKIYTDKKKSKTDDITSRIFWLEGLEEGVNKGKNIDSYKRYIYIHGTSEEGRLGLPASHGCIRMKNKEVIDLYNTIEVGTLVLIL